MCLTTSGTQDSARYIKPNGKPLTPAEQRKIGLSIVSKSADALEELTQTYVDGAISFEIGLLGCAKASRLRIAQWPSLPLAAKSRWAQGSAGSWDHCSCSNMASSASSCWVCSPVRTTRRQVDQRNMGSPAGSATQNQSHSVRSMPGCSRNAASSSRMQIIARNAFRKQGRDGSQLDRSCR